MLTHYETEAYQKGYQRVAGVDEVGRGPLAGPVVAAACVLPKTLIINEIDDSKKLTPAKRLHFYHFLTSHPDIVYGVGVVDAPTIDALNIYQATKLAMIQALAALPQSPDCVLIDGMSLTLPDIHTTKIIKGDTKSQSIAAAAIIAKVLRDHLMATYATRYPAYGFASHKGYGTARHLAALNEQGPCEIHRFTFEPIKSL